MSTARKFRRRAQRERARELGEAMIVAIDGGFGAKAIAAVSVLPRGPRRDLEIALWVSRASEHETIAWPITPTTTDAELAALIDLQCAIEGIP